MKNLKFIHITKTGGTSIEDAGYANGILWGRFDKEYTKGIPPNWHKPFILINRQLKDKYDWFTVVRNPYERIVSEFYCKWTPPKNKDISILEYNQVIKQNILERRSKKFGFHYYEQYLYIDPKINIHIIKFENIEFEFNELMKKYYLPTQLDKKNIGKKKYSVNDLYDDTLELIETIYHKDFILFNYEKR